MSDAKCGLCGEPMPVGEEMFKYHGFSGPCPKPPLTRAAAAPAPEGLDERISPGQQHEAHRIASIYGVWEREKNELHILRALRARPALSDEERAALSDEMLRLFRLAHEQFCSNKCPSVFRSKDEPRHLPDCDAMRAVLARQQEGK